MRIQRSYQARGTHFLSSAEGGISQDTKKMERNRGELTLYQVSSEGQIQDAKTKQESKEHSLAVECRREKKVRTAREIERARVTHSLPRTEGEETSQDTKRKRENTRHSLPVKCGEESHDSK